MTFPRTIQRLATVGVASALLAAACGGDDTASQPSTTSAIAPTTTASAPDPAEMAAFQDDVTELCAGGSALAELPPNDGTPEGVAAQLEVLTATRGPLTLDMLSVPDELASGFDQIEELAAEAEESLAQAVEAAEAGDVALAEQNIDRHLSQLSTIDGGFAILGARCFMGDPARAAAADLNVMVGLGAEQLNAGFGSVWVSQMYGGSVARVDPKTGEVLATVEVGAVPLKLQAADGRMWVRTQDAFVAIDPETNTVTDTLAKADVGPEVNRNWAVDGTMWICDGHRLHRYDPTTLEPITVIDLTISCDFVYEGSGLVVVWTYDEDPAESGNSSASVIDPATNEVLATIELPVDVLFPAVSDDVVFFAGNLNSTAVVVDRATWSVSSTMDLPRDTGGGGVATDGGRSSSDPRRTARGRPRHRRRDPRGRRRHPTARGERRPGPRWFAMGGA